MSQSTNTSVINFCDVYNLSFETKKGLYRHQSYDLKHKELMEKMFESDEEPKIKPVPGWAKSFRGCKERVYEPEEDDYVYNPKANTKDIFKTKIETKTKPKPKTESDIYSKIKYECKECNVEIRNKIALTTHSYSHNRKYLENTEYFDINSCQNMREFYITDKAGNNIEDIDESINNSLNEIKSCYQF